MANKTLSVDAIEPEVQRLARALYQKAARAQAGALRSPGFVGPHDRLVARTTSLCASRLFRFVDVLPSLESSTEIGRHLEEYFARVDHALGGLAFLAQALHAGTLVAPFVRRNVIKLARRFIAEESGDHLSQVLSEPAQRAGGLYSRCRRRGDRERGEAAAMQQRYLELLRRLAKLSADLAGLRADRRSPNGKHAPRQFIGQAFFLVRALRSARSRTPKSIVRERLRELFREAAQARRGDYRRHGAVRFQRSDPGDFSRRAGGRRSFRQRRRRRSHCKLISKIAERMCAN